MKMSKQQAVDLFGGQVKGLAAALGVTSSAISQWPMDLRPEQVDRVLGAALRMGVIRECPSGCVERSAQPAEAA